MTQDGISCSVLIVSFNTRELTLACLASLQTAELPDNSEVLVVDNNSADGTAEAIRTEHSSVTLIQQSENLGFGRANNVAAQQADGEYLLLLNSDTEVTPGSVARLLRFAEENPVAGIWGGRTIFADGSLNPASCWRKQTLWSVFCRATGLSTSLKGSRWFDPEAYGGWGRNSVREVDIVSGCFLLIRRELWDRLGGFDESFFMYGEDADLCLRARKIGARPMITPEATIIHHGGASETSTADKQVRLLKAKSQLIRRHWPAWKIPVGLFLIRMAVFNRGVLAKLRVPGVSHRWQEKALVWWDVWTRRQEWCNA